MNEREGERFLLSNIYTNFTDHWELRKISNHRTRCMQTRVLRLSFLSSKQKLAGRFYICSLESLFICPSVRLTFRRHHITINRYRRSRIYAKDKQNPLEIYLVFLFNFSSNTYTQFFGILRTSSGIKKNSNPIQILWNCWLLLVVKVNEVLMDVLFIF